MNYKHDLPENKGVENGIKRAKQMTAIRWTPLEPLASSTSYFTKEGRQHADTFFQPFIPQHGMIYSSVLKNQKFLGYNISLETFMTALSNTDSVLYKKNVHGQGRNNAGCWYGIVCSCFASFVHDLPDRVICRDWPKIPGILALGKPDVSELKLLDVVLNTKKHIAVITDILRDENGTAKLIEVSEATLPQCKATYFTGEEFELYWYGRDFDIYRIPDCTAISYEPSPFVRVEGDAERKIEADPVLPPYEYNRILMPDQGNRSNYSAAEPVTIDLLDPSFSFVKIREENAAEKILPVEGSRITFTGLPAGTYQVSAGTEEDGAFSAPVSFTITDLTVTGEKTEYLPGEEMTLSYTQSAGPEPYAVNLNRASTSGEVKKAFLSSSEHAEKKISMTVPTEPGEFFVYLSAKNENGVYISNKFEFLVADEQQ